VFKYFLRKEITDKYLGNSSAILWIVIHPVISLLIYNLVFGIIFKARVPELPENAFVAYLAIGLWPWMAFSESVINSITSVVSRKDLLGKVKIDLRYVVLAGVTANFILNGIGFLAILIVLSILGKLPISVDLFLLLIPLAMLYLLAIGLSLLFSALYVFYRDLKQIITAIFPLIFFCTPIIYAWSIIPEKIKIYFSFNPLLPIINYIHDAVFGINQLNWMAMLYIFLFALMLLIFSNKFFQKLAPRFDDFA
jgi:lipopolysaccharide transport system permease protein